jgi:hypothetical protein
MDCPVPQCGGDTRVVTTVTEYRIVIRRRRCVKCGTKFVTRERTLRITAGPEKGGEDGQDTPHALASARAVV